MGFKWKPSKAAIKKFVEEMREIDNFCLKNGITQSRGSDSYYFQINAINYRVSNHTIESSNRRAYNADGEKVREEYHENGREADTVYIHASKTRIIEIYENLKAGRKLDGFGDIKRD